MHTGAQAAQAATLSFIARALPRIINLHQSCPLRESGFPGRPVAPGRLDLKHAPAVQSGVRQIKEPMIVCAAAGGDS